MHNREKGPKKVQASVKLPEDVMERIRNYAESDMRSINQTIAIIVRKGMEVMKI